MQWDVHIRGVILELQEQLQQINVPSTFASISKYLKKAKCSCCHGTQLKDEVLCEQVCEMSIADVDALPMSEFRLWLLKVIKQCSKSSINRQVEQLVDQMDGRAAKMLELHSSFTATLFLPEM